MTKKFKRKILAYVIPFRMVETGDRFIYGLKEYRKISENFAKEIITEEICQFINNTLVLWEGN